MFDVVVTVSTVLPFRLDWLNHKWTNHRVDASVQGAWLLAATDGPCALVTVAGDSVHSNQALPDTSADAVLRCTSQDLLSFLLGCPPSQPLKWEGNAVLGAKFTSAFPGP